MKKSILLTVFLLSFTKLAFSQNVTIGVSGKPLQLSNKSTTEGNPYFNPASTKSSLLTTSGKQIDLPAVKYNLYTQEVEYSDNNQIYAVQDSLKGFTILDSAGIKHNFVKMNAGKENLFFGVLATGKIELLKHYSAKKATTEDWYTKKQTKKIVPQSTYYYSKNGVIEKLNISEKKLLPIFSGKESLVKTFISEKSPDLKTEAGLVAVFDYYNTL